MRIWRALGAAALTVALGATAACGADDGEDQPGASLSGSSSPTEAATPPSTAPESSTAPETSEVTASTEETGPTGETEPPTSGPPTSATTTAPVDLTRGPETYAEAEAHLAAARVDGSATSAKRFSTPGDIVYCVLSSTYNEPTCELRIGMIKDPAVCGRALSDFVGRVVLTPRAAEPECNTDTIREPGAAVVQPTGVVRSGPVECAVESIGVTCVDGRHGFFITQGDYATF